MTKRIVILSALLSLGAFAAQAAERTGVQLRDALVELTASGVPSGVLYDRVLPMSHLATHDGRAEAPPVAAAQWRQMLDELARASVAVPAWPDAAQLREAGRAARGSDVVPLGVLDVAYDRLRPDALERRLIAWEGQRLVAQPGAGPDDLFAPARAFAATALLGETYHGERVDFVLPARFVVTNDGAVAARFELDPADGGGFRPLRPDAPLRVHYARTGRYTVRLRATLADGAIRNAAFPFEVRALATPLPTETWALTATIPYLGAPASGEAFVYLADGHATVTNPVIAVEGFDLDNSMGWDELYFLLNREELLETMRADGYDAVVLNFTEATDYVQRNAFLLVELIQRVQAVAAGGREPFVVGASMGGLVARYALAYMETQGLAHGVREFVSFDAPQMGANIPLGLQYWLDFFQGDSTEAAYLLSRLDTPASRQLLLYHHTTPPGATGQSDPLRAALLSDLTTVGDWPQLPRKVAVANGSGARTNQGYAAGAQLISYEYASFLVDITGNVWAVPDVASTRIFQGLVNLIGPLPDRSRSVTVNATRPWDNAPGGYRASMAQMDTTAVPYGDIVSLHDNHCFIPTVSALALSTDDPFFDIAGAPDLLAMTPFDAVYYPTTNEEHVLVTPQNKAWFLSEVERAPSDVAPTPSAPPRVPVLAANVPNPFNPSTRVRFTLPRATIARLELYDARGRRVRTLMDGPLPAGDHEVVWRGDDDRGERVASGNYRARLRTAEGNAWRGIVLVK